MLAETSLFGSSRSPKISARVGHTSTQAGEYSPSRTGEGTLQVVDAEHERRIVVSHADRDVCRRDLTTAVERNVRRNAARNTFGAMKFDHFFTDNFFSALSLELLKDDFKDLNLRAILGLGLGARPRSVRGRLLQRLRGNRRLGGRVGVVAADLDLRPGMLADGARQRQLSITRKFW